MQEKHDDSGLSSSRREAILVLLIWLAAMSYSPGYGAEVGER